MWRSGFFFHEMSFGLLSVFLPLYVLEITGGAGALIATGLMVTLANLATIPFAYVWGYLCDKTQRYKAFIMFSFLSTTIIIYLFTLFNTLPMVILLYVALNVLHVAHEPPKNVLIAEYYPRQDWEKNYASYEALTELGKVAGLLLGFFIAGASLGSASMLYASSLLNAAGLAASIMFLADPTLVFERSLVSIERTLGIAQKGFTFIYKGLEGASIGKRLQHEHTTLFFAGLTMFAIATSMLFTPLPIFFGQTLALSSSLVFVVFLLNSLGGVAGYLFAQRKAEQTVDTVLIHKTLLLRTTLTLLLIPATVWISTSTTVLAAATLVFLGYAYALFLVSTLAISMELAPRNVGLFTTLSNLGNAAGCFAGPYIAQTFGFTSLFIVASLGFFLSLIAFKAFSTHTKSGQT